jgi:hypothetical protein
MPAVPTAFGMFSVSPAAFRTTRPAPFPRATEHPEGAHRVTVQGNVNRARRSCFVVRLRSVGRGRHSPTRAAGTRLCDAGRCEGQSLVLVHARPIPALTV